MTDQDTERKIRDVIAKKFAGPSDSIGLDSRLREDLGIDSFGGIELMFELEEAFDVKIPDSGIEQVRTIRDIVAVIRSLQTGSAG